MNGCCLSYVDMTVSLFESYHDWLLPLPYVDDSKFESYYDWLLSLWYVDIFVSQF